MKAFTVLSILFIIVSVSIGQNPPQQGTGRDPACCSCSGGYPSSSGCNDPSNIGANPITGLQSDCPAGRCTSCPTCMLQKNEDFDKECSANVVFIIDNSGSLEDFCVATVRPALFNFFDGFVNVANVGGAVKAGVITFSTEAQVVFELTDVTTPNFVSNVKLWVAGNAANGHPGYCKMMSGTNWGAPLELARTHTWGDVVDIWILFTDGFPQCAGTFAPQTTCAKSCFNRRGGPDEWFEDQLCNPSSTCSYNKGNDGLTFSGDSDDTRSGLWAACHAADELKKLNKKLFVVGVGGLDGHEAKIQMLAGTRLWNGLPNTFGTSDYIISTELGDLGTIFNQIISGLCDCLQAQKPCAADTNGPPVTGGNNCDATRFEAFVRITTTANVVSTVYPPRAITAGKVYYNFIPSPETRVAFEYFTTGNDIGDAPTVVRTDRLNPCTIERRINCGGSCVEISEKQRLPRFFRELGDTACGGSTCTGAVNVAACPLGFTKIGSNLDEVKYFWTLADGRTPCAAENGDGTFFEFFGSNVNTDRGVVNTMPRTFGFNFNPTTQCVTDVNCTTPVELLIIIDERAAIASSTFNAMKEFAGNVVTKLQPGPTYNPDFTFGFAFTGSYSDTEEPRELVGMTAGRNFVTNLLLPRPQVGGGTNFALVTSATMNKYWQGVNSPTQRAVLILVGGPDGVTGDYAALQVEASNYGAEIFAVGVDRGAGNIDLLQSLATPGPFQRYTAVLNPNDLNAAVADGFLTLTVRGICPQTNACGKDCLGFCECVTAPTCKCPTCTNTEACNTYECTNPTIGCKGQPFNCDDGAACTTDSCVEPTGCRNVLEDTCGANCVCVNSTGDCFCTVPCTNGCPNTACYDQECDLTSGNCVITTERNCNDNNPCTVDSCVNPTGCINEEFQCNQVSTCFVTECIGALANGQPNCKPNRAVNCTDNDACTEDSCVEDFGCRNQNLTCSATSNCNFPIGCIGKDDDGNELAERNCIISNSTCFSTVESVPIAGIAAGIIAAIVVAGVIAALLIFFLSKKGYDAYTARSDMGVPSMMQNPTFTESNTAGTFAE